MAPRVNDKKTLNSWLRSLRTTGLVISPPAAGDERTVTDGHLDIAELLDRKKLPVETTPYIFWNDLGEYEKGELVGELSIFYGGGRESVRQILVDNLPDGFALGGARTANEAFLLRRKFDVGDLDWTDGKAVHAIVERLTRGYAKLDRARRKIIPPQTPEELAFLEQVLRQSELTGPARARAFALLISSDALSPELLALAAADPTEIFKIAGKWSWDVIELVVELWNGGRLPEAERLALQISQDVLADCAPEELNGDKSALAEAVLVAAPTPATLAVAEAADLLVATFRIRPTVTGEPMHPYVVQRLNQIVAADEMPQYPRLKHWLLDLYPAPDPQGPFMTEQNRRKNLFAMLDAAQRGTPVWDFLVDEAKNYVKNARYRVQSLTRSSDEDRAAAEQFAAEVAAALDIDQI